MKQGTNVFVIIDLITLTCGQLHGLTPEQSTELNRLKRQLDIRFAASTQSIEVVDTSIEENERIIEQMERIDSSVAAMYKEKQDALFIPNEIVALKFIIDENFDGDNQRNFDEMNWSIFDPVNKGIVELIGKIKLARKIVAVDNYNGLYWGVGNLIKRMTELLKIKKNNKQLSVNNFNQIAQAIRSMKDISFPSKRTKNISKSIAMQIHMLSTLKKNLYAIYEVKQAAENKITILYDYTWSILGYPFSIRLRSKPQDDLLVAIPSHFKEETLEEEVRKAIEAWVPTI